MNHKHFALLAIIALAFIACDDDTHTHEWGAWQYDATQHWKECTANDGAEYGRANHTGDPCTVCGYATPTPHESTITAFGKTATVIGDAAISTADFNTAKGKLEEAMVFLSASGDLKFNVMLDRDGFKIIIQKGNDGPDADANKSMTVGIDYLLANDAVPTIAIDIGMKVLLDNAFADPDTPTVPAPATITHTSAPNALAFTGSVTIKSDDPYTAAEWDAVVAKVVAKLNALYDATEVPVLYTTVFGGNGVEIVLVNNLATNCEVKKTLPEGEGVKGVLYIKTDSVNSISLDHYEMVFTAVYQNDSFTPL